MGYMGEWRVPDVLEPLYGYRIWKYGEDWVEGEFADSLQPYLQSYAKPTVWTGRELTFKCHSHKKPNAECMCGIWGCWSIKDLNYVVSYAYGDSQYILGRIKGYGGCIISDRGFRAEHVEIQAFIDVHPETYKFANLLGVPLEEDLYYKTFKLRIPYVDQTIKPLYIRTTEGTYMKWDMIEERSAEFQVKLAEEGWSVEEVLRDEDRVNNETVLEFRCVKEDAPKDELFPF